MTTAADGKGYPVLHYSVEMIIAIGFRVKGVRGTQFRIWANNNLKEYLLKGFVMDDERLKNPDGRPDYFDEFLVRIRDRADASKKNMGLTSWKGSVVRKQDITIAKNYLTEDEVDTLNRLVTIFLETAELRVKDRIDITMRFWQENVDKVLRFNDKAVLSGVGSISNASMKQEVAKTYLNFDQRRKVFEAEQADLSDLEDIKTIEKAVKNRN